jgi:hypothetical protein
VRAAGVGGAASEGRVLHLELSNSAQSVAGTTPFRSFAMIPTNNDPMTVVDILAADSLGASGLANGVLIKELTATNPRAEVTDSSTFIYYVIRQGSIPQAVWMDAPDLPSASGGAGAITVVGPVSGPYLATVGELVLVSAPLGGTTITLPSPAGVTGQRVQIKDTGGSAGTNHIVVKSVSGNVDGSGSITISTNYGFATCVSDGSNWWLV